MPTSKSKRTPAIVFTANTTSVSTWNGAPKIAGETARLDISRNMAARMLRESRNKERIKALAMSDELFESEVINLDDVGCVYSLDACVCDYRPRRECSEHPSITVIQKEKHFRNRRYLVLPSFNEDLDEEKECEVL